MKVEVSNFADTMVVKPHGDIRVKTVLALRSNLAALDKDESTSVAIDLAEVMFIDSSGVGLLLNFAKRLLKRGGRLSLVNYSRDVKDLLDITGIEQVVDLYDDFEKLKSGMAGGEK